MADPGTASAAEQSLRNGDPFTALKHLQEAVRGKSADAKLRIFLFQLLAVLGQWDRALNQLNVAATLDASVLDMATTYREAMHCEVVREHVFQGKQSPLVLGEPEPWIALLIESLLRAGKGDGDAARALREKAFEDAPPSAGTLNGEPFAWIADADMRLGPVLEAIIEGRYYWVPFHRLTRVAIEAPADLRDIVWMPAHLQLENGGEAYALIPTRYDGSEKADDGALVMGRKTQWDEQTPDFYRGLGQRVFATDRDEVSLMDVRDISIEHRDRAPTA